jgi:hypothetical protein
MHEDVLAQITREETSAAVWTSLHAMFSAQNEGNAIGIRTQLSNCRRHDMPASDYYHKMVSMADTMANIGEPLKDSEVISYILPASDRPTTTSSPPSPSSATRGPSPSVNSTATCAPTRLAWP